MAGGRAGDVEEREAQAQTRGIQRRDEPGLWRAGLGSRPQGTAMRNQDDGNRREDTGIDPFLQNPDGFA